MKYILTAFVVSVSLLLKAQSCNPDSLKNYQIRASDTDPNISWKLNKHYAWFNPTCLFQNTLLVHLVGSYDNPQSTTLFPELAANNGFHVVSLKYPNSTAAQTACGNSSDPDCYLNFRKEIIEGIDYSIETTVDSSNSISNRLIKLLQYLDSNYPSENWSNYFSANVIDWSKIIVSGHSQGGGHAAVIAISKPVKRVLMFASPNDYSTFFNAPASWTSSPHTAQDSAYYGFNNLNDDVVDFSEQFQSWNNLGMPSFGDSIYVDNTTYPYFNSRQLYTRYDTSGIGGNHSVMILDSKTPIDGFGIPKFEPVWKYMLGIPSAPSGIHSNILVQGVKIFPNPMSDFSTVEVNNMRVKWSWTLFNSLGQTLQYKDNIINSQIAIRKDDLTSGVYLYRVLTADGRVASGKLTIE